MGQGVWERGMNVLWRLLGALFALVIVAMATVAVALTVSRIELSYWVAWLERVRGDDAWVVRIGSVLVVLLACVYFAKVTRRRKEPVIEGITQRTAYGDVLISLDTIENVALKVASRTRSMYDWKAQVRVGEQGIALSFEAYVDGEAEIPPMSEDVQRAVKEAVERIAGVPVTTVGIRILNMTKTGRMAIRPPEKQV